MKPTERVAVIGAGMSGLVAVKELLDEGQEVVAFERERTFGGNFTTGAAYDRMKLTISNYFMAFSSLAPPEGEERKFWTREEYREYLRRFVATFGLDPHLRLHSNVRNIHRVGEKSFRVTVESKDGIKEEEFSAIAFCRGAHRNESPRMIQLPGVENYTGEVMHTAAWRGPGEFTGKRVVCVGMGETSADITKEISDVSEACWLSMRHHPVLVQRYPHGGVDTNDAFAARVTHWGSREFFFDKLDAIEEAMLPEMSPHDRLIFEWTAKASPGRFIQKNDCFVDNVVDGKIEPVFSAIQRLDGKTVTFENGKTVEADAIMLCTGYEESSIPATWLDGLMVPDIRQLYKHSLHPKLGARVAFIGWARPMQGGVPACSEMQSRFFALLCSGARSLPPADVMRQEIERDKQAEEALTQGNPYIRTLVHYTDYMDGMADLIGCKPDLERYLDDPEFLYRLICGSNIAACYRLTGPHADPEGARKLISRLPIAVDLSKTHRQILPEILPDALRRLPEPLAARILCALQPRLQQLASV